MTKLMTTDPTALSASNGPGKPPGEIRRGPFAVLEWILARALFPALVGGNLYWAITRIEAGTPPAEAILPPTIFSYLLIASLERLFFWQREWLRSRGDLRVDLAHLLISGVFTIQLLTVPITLGAVVAASWLARLVGGTFWPTDWSLWVQLPLALVFGEFFLYWIHRLTHEFDLLWRFHAMHHSAPRLYFLNAVRFHPVDIALSSFSPLIPLIIVGADGRLIALFGLFSAVHGLFQHANLVLKLGPLNWFFSMAELHRWHHSRLERESNTNYGQNLIVWDIIFGTRFLPKDREPPADIGISKLDAFPMTWWQQLISPLVWRRIKSDSAPPTLRHSSE